MTTSIVLTGILLVMIGTPWDQTEGRLKLYPSYRNNNYLPHPFKQYLESKMNIHRNYPVKGQEEDGIIETECEAKSWIEENPENAFIYYILHWIGTEGGWSVQLSESTKLFPLRAGPRYTRFQDYTSIYLEITVVALRPSATPGCKIFDVIAKVENPPADAGGDCYLALVNRLLTMSCPPNHLPTEYRLLSLFSVSPYDPSDYGYAICAESGKDDCRAGPARALSFDNGDTSGVSIAKSDNIGHIYIT